MVLNDPSKKMSSHKKTEVSEGLPLTTVVRKCVRDIACPRKCKVSGIWMSMSLENNLHKR